MRKKARQLLWLVSGLLVAGQALLAGCARLGLQSEPLPTLFIIPTLTPSITPSLTLFLSPTTTPSQTPTPTSTSTSTPTPLIGATSTPSGAAITSTAGAAGGLALNYFTPTPTEVSPGGTVTLAWSVSGATQVTLFRVNADGSFGQSWPNQGATDQETVTASSAGTSEKFVLRASDGITTAEWETTITLTCNRSWFFTESPPGSCPSAMVSTLAAEQNFEHGWMYWVQTSGKVYVLYEDGLSPAWEVYDDTWTSSEPEYDPSLTPPSGLEQPKRGIGKVWRNNTTVRSRLGWAMGGELGYTSTFQQEAGSNPQNIFFAEPARQLVRLESGGSAWRFGESLP